MRVPAGITIVNRSMFATEPKGDAVTKTHRPLRTDVVPEICVDGAAAALDFYAAAFGAEKLFRHALDDGRVLHAEVSFDGFVIFVVDDFPEMHGGRGTSPTAIGGTPVCLHRDVPDVDASVEGQWLPVPRCYTVLRTCSGATATPASSTPMVTTGRWRRPDRALTSRLRLWPRYNSTRCLTHHDRPGHSPSGVVPFVPGVHAG